VREREGNENKGRDNAWFAVLSKQTTRVIILDLFFFCFTIVSLFIKFLFLIPWEFVEY